MSANVPSAFPLPVANDTERIRLGGRITTTEITDLCERPVWNYASMNRRVLLERAWQGDVEMTSTSYVVVMEVLAVMATTRADVDIVVYGKNMDILVEIEDTAGSAIGSDTLSVGSGAFGSDTGSITSITSQTVIVRVSAKVPSTGGVEFRAIRVLEQALTDAEVP